MGDQAQTLRLQREGAAAGKGVVETRQDVGVEELRRPGMVGVGGAGVPPGATDLGAGAFQEALLSELQKFTDRYVDVSTDSSKQSGRYVSCFMKRNGRSPTIFVPVLLMRSALPNLAEAMLFQ